MVKLEYAKQNEISKFPLALRPKNTHPVDRTSQMSTLNPLISRHPVNNPVTVICKVFTFGEYTDTLLVELELCYRSAYRQSCICYLGQEILSTLLLCSRFAILLMKNKNIKINSFL